MERSIFRYNKILLTSLLLVCGSGCTKFITVDPPIDQLNSNQVFKTDNTAIAAINGIYSTMMENPELVFSSGVTLNMGMTADELYYYTPGQRDEFVNNTLQANSEVVINGQFWGSLYRYIYGANSCIESASASGTLTAATKNQVIGEAFFIRAFSYFYLINTFGPVPLVTSSDYLKNIRLSRVSEEEVYQQIIADLKAAKANLEITTSSAEKTRPDKYAASALLARVYLYHKDWADAVTESESLLTSGHFNVSDVPLDEVFLNDSRETIWQLKPVNGVLNSYIGNLILPASENDVPTFLFRKDFISAFEPGDLRKASWVKNRTYLDEVLYYPYKYKVRGQAGVQVTEYYVVLRLAEQYLIHAEAKANQGELAAAREDLDLIRKRAGLHPLKTDLSQIEVLAAVQQERRIELLAEWGNRWMDLKRTNKVDQVIGILKPTWKPTAKLWPVPASELVVNPALLPQNNGY